MEQQHYKEDHPLWEWWAGVLVRRPRSIIAGCLIVTALLGVKAATTPIDLSFTGLLDGNDPEVIAYQDALETFGAGSMLVLLLEGEAAKLDEAAEELVTKLPKVAPVANITPPADPQWAVDRAAWLWPEGLFESAIAAVGSGADESVGKRIALADEVIRKTVRPQAEALLISIELPGGPLDMAMGGRDFMAVEAETREILAPYGDSVKWDFTGIAAIGAQDQYSVFQRVKILTPLTLLAVLALIFFIETRYARVAAAGIALGSSVIVAFGMVSLVEGRISIIVTFFGMLLIGLGIDFGIHLLVALRDAHSRGLTPEESIRYGISHTGTAIFLGGVSTALAFGAVATVPEAGARSMGLAALFGLSASTFLMLSFLPCAWLLIERRAKHGEAPPRFRLPALAAVVTIALKRPRAILAIGLLLVVLGVTGIPRYRLESDLRKIISRNVPALDVEARLQELYGVSPVMYTAPVESLEQAAEWTGKLEAMPEVGEVASVTKFITRDSDTRRKKMELAMASAAKDDPIATRLARSLESGPITLEGLPASFTAGLVGKEGKLAIRVVPRELLLDAHTSKERTEVVRSVAPTATGMPVIAQIAIIGRQDYIPIMIPAILIIVSVVLSIAFRNVVDVVLGLIPVVIGTAATFGIFLWFELQFNTLTSVVVPVILGLGVDNGIHVVARLRRFRARTDASIHEAVEGVGRAIFLTTITTVMSFVGLLLTDHAGMESIAYFMLIGVPLCFLASITALPAAAKLLNRESVTDSHG